MNVHAVLAAMTTSMQSRWPSAAKEALMTCIRRLQRSLSTSLRRASLTVQARAHRHSLVRARSPGPERAHRHVDAQLYVL